MRHDRAGGGLDLPKDLGLESLTDEQAKQIVGGEPSRLDYPEGFAGTILWARDVARHREAEAEALM